MVFFHGKHHYVLIGKESTWGTAVSATKDVGLVQNLTRNDNLNYRTIHAVGSVEPQQIASGKFDLTGTLTFNYQHGRIFEYLLGGSVTDTQQGSSSDWKHEFTVADTLPSFTMEEGYDASSDVERIWKGCKVLSMTLGIALDGVLVCRADIGAKDIDPSGTTASAITIDNLPPLKDFQADLKWGTEDSETSLDGVQNFELVINNVGGGTPKIWGLNSKLPQAMDANQRTYTFRFTKAFESASLYQDFLGNTNGVLNDGSEIATKGIILNIHNNVAAESGRREIYIDGNDATIWTVGTPTAIGGYVLQDFEGQFKSIESFFTMSDIANALN